MRLLLQKLVMHCAVEGDKDCSGSVLAKATLNCERGGETRCVDPRMAF